MFTVPPLIFQLQPASERNGISTPFKHPHVVSQSVVPLLTKQPSSSQLPQPAQTLHPDVPDEVEKLFTGVDGSGTERHQPSVGASMSSSFHSPFRPTSPQRPSPTFASGLPNLDIVEARILLPSDNSVVAETSSIVASESTKIFPIPTAASPASLSPLSVSTQKIVSADPPPSTISKSGIQSAFSGLTESVLQKKNLWCPPLNPKVHYVRQKGQCHQDDKNCKCSYSVHGKDLSGCPVSYVSICKIVSPAQHTRPRGTHKEYISEKKFCAKNVEPPIQRPECNWVPSRDKNGCVINFICQQDSTKRLNQSATAENRGNGQRFSGSLKSILVPTHPGADNGHSKDQPRASSGSYKSAVSQPLQSAVGGNSPFERLSKSFNYEGQPDPTTTLQLKFMTGQFASPEVIEAPKTEKDFPVPDSSVHSGSTSATIQLPQKRVLTDPQQRGAAIFPIYGGVKLARAKKIELPEFLESGQFSYLEI